MEPKYKGASSGDYTVELALGWALVLVNLSPNWGLREFKTFCLQTHKSSNSVI